MTLGTPWRTGASLLTVSIVDVETIHESMLDHDAAPKTINRRLSALWSFYSICRARPPNCAYRSLCPNPAHAQFIAREPADAREETKACPSRAGQLMNLASGESVLEYRDRAILKFYI